MNSQAPAGPDAAGGSRFLVSLAVMAATVIQVLDTTIVNVALPHMAGELSATTHQISWVLTSYIVASSIVMPMTGFLTDPRTYAREASLHKHPSAAREAVGAQET